MITRRLLAPSSALSPTSWTCAACTRASLLSRTRMSNPSRRGLQQLPILSHAESFRNKGIDGLLSPEGYKIAWVQYQTMMIQKLNSLLAGSPYENTKVKDLALQFARDPQSASIFNYASMAFNNHFFFSTFSTAPRKLHQQGKLEKSLLNTFGSVETLQTTFLDTADAMFGPGFVWLVWAREPGAAGGLRGGSWRILVTYLAGTPFPEAGYRQQGIDMNTNNVQSFNNYLSDQPVNHVGAFGSFSQMGRDQSKLPPGGANVMPVLCVNTWEHVWLRDYGMNGKRAFLRDWWSSIDWSVVESYAPSEAFNTGIFQSA
ncbi:hypothetical protein M433DRAFT_98726 [Acidomyces richmondensis BFW]|nr:MAG: hypothetical protein FE78DRAFT_180719 [Acidomyces sp. 'richmondensis']KYG50715.1 hypothetical protein M433DRAFT_98726 [Acidomyces richmondensis BFW]